MDQADDWQETLKVDSEKLNPRTRLIQGSKASMGSPCSDPARVSR